MSLSKVGLEYFSKCGREGRGASDYPTTFNYVAELLHEQGGVIEVPINLG